MGFSAYSFLEKLLKIPFLGLTRCVLGSKMVNAIIEYDNNWASVVGMVWKLECMRVLPGETGVNGPELVPLT